MDPSANQQQPTSQAPPQNAYPPQQQPQSGQPQVVQQTQHGDQQPLDDLLAHVSQRLQVRRLSPNLANFARPPTVCCSRQSQWVCPTSTWLFSDTFYR